MPRQFHFRFEQLLEYRKALELRAECRLNQHRWVIAMLYQAIRLSAMRAEVARQELGRSQARAIGAEGGWAMTISNSRAELAAKLALIADLQKKVSEAEGRLAMLERDFQNAWSWQERLKALKRLDQTRFRRQQDLDEAAELAEIGSVMHYLSNSEESDASHG